MARTLHISQIAAGTWPQVNLQSKLISKTKTNNDWYNYV